MQLRKNILGWGVAGFAAIIASATSLHAAPIVWEFSGTITEIGIGPLRPRGITVGMPFSGSVTFDSDWPIVARDVLTMGAAYGGGGDPYGIEILVGDIWSSTFSSDLPIWYTVADDRTNPLDGAVTDFLAISDRPPTSIGTRIASLLLEDDTAALLSSEELVVVPPDLSQLSSATLTLLGLPSELPMSDGTYAQGRIEHLSAREIVDVAVPEPTAALPFAVGAVAAARFVRKRRPASR